MRAKVGRRHLDHEPVPAEGVKVRTGDDLPVSPEGTREAAPDHQPVPAEATMSRSRRTRPD